MYKKYLYICAAFVALSLVLFGFFVPNKSAYAATVSRGEAAFEVASGRMLFAENENRCLPPASTTKILTAIVILEDCNTDAVVTVPESCCGVEGSSIYLVPGEKVTVRDLLYGLMLRSGNDCAETLALYHSGSIEGFAKVMNERAHTSGALDSRFKNPHGLPCEGHYTTAHDLGAIAAYALRNQDFSKIVQTEEYVIADGGCGYARVLKNKNKMLSLYEGADGVKTGFTKEAGRCLVASASRGGMRVVAAVLNSPQMYERCEELLNECFAKYSLRHIFDKNSYSARLDTDLAWKKCTVCCEKDAYYPLSENEAQSIRTEIKLPSVLSLPVKKGQAVGDLNIYLQNQLIFSQKIVSIMDVERNFADIIREIAGKNRTRGNGCASINISPNAAWEAEEPAISSSKKERFL